MVVNHIWHFLSKNEKKRFSILIGLSVIVLFLEILSISAIFPFIYSLIDTNFLNKYAFLSQIYSKFEIKSSYFSIIVLFFFIINNFN